VTGKAGDGCGHGQDPLHRGVYFEEAGTGFFHGAIIVGPARSGAHLVVPGRHDGESAIVEVCLRSHFLCQKGAEMLVDAKHVVAQPFVEELEHFEARDFAAFT